MKLTRWLDRHLLHIASGAYVGAIAYGVVVQDWSGVLRLVPLAIVTIWLNAYRNRTNDRIKDRAFSEGWFAGIARYDAVLDGHIDEGLRAHLLFNNWNAPLTRQQFTEQMRQVEEELALLERPSAADRVAVYRKYHRGEGLSD